MIKKVGEKVSPLKLTNIHDVSITVPQKGKLTHIQFRRFAGCPICNMHLKEFLDRANELDNHDIQEIVVFQASVQKIQQYVVSGPFIMVSDMDKKLYEYFGVESSWKSLINKKAVGQALKGLSIKPFTNPEKLESELILPADFLIDENGSIVALHYGTHASDQWTIDDLLNIVANHQNS